MVSNVFTNPPQTTKVEKNFFTSLKLHFYCESKI